MPPSNFEIEEALAAPHDELAALGSPKGFPDPLVPIQSELDITSKEIEECLTASIPDDHVFLEMETTMTEPTMEESVISEWDAASDNVQIVTPIVSTPPRRSPKAQKRRVSFASLHVREYSQVLGDHPCCSYGPPVSLGWDYNVMDSVSLETYEATRPRRRTRQQLRMTFHERRSVLLSHSDGDMRRAQRKIYRERPMNEKRQKLFFQPTPPPPPPHMFMRATE